MNFICVRPLNFGCRPEKLDEIVKIHAAGGDMDRINNGDLYRDRETFMRRKCFGKFNHPAKVEQLKDVMDCIFLHSWQILLSG